MSDHTQPCEMWADPSGKCNCGQPATLGMPMENGSLIPICEDCIRWTGNSRRYLKKLTPTPLNKQDVSR